MPQLITPFEFHDSTIASISVGPRREVTFGIDLCSVRYFHGLRVSLRFGGIRNFEAVIESVRQIESMARDEYIGCRIDALEVTPGAGDCCVVLETDWISPIEIQCSKVSVTKV